MNLNLDMEIIKSALLFGDLDDAMERLNKSINRIEFQNRVTREKRNTKELAFLEDLKLLLEGKITLDDFKSRVNATGIDMDNSKIYGEDTLQSLYYMLELVIDRYNIKFPYFDGKRCDDK
jgi:hypothetical protein